MKSVLKLQRLRRRKIFMKNSSNLTRDDLILRISKSKFNIYTLAELADLSVDELEKLLKQLVDQEIAEKNAREAEEDAEEDGTTAGV